MLENESDISLAGGTVGGIFTGEEDLTFVGEFKASDDAEEGSFSRA